MKKQNYKQSKTNPMKKHGGKRLNAGRKPKYNEPTKTVSFRIPISKETIIRETVKNILL